MAEASNIIKTRSLWVRTYMPIREHDRNAPWWRRILGLVPTPHRELVREAQRAGIECAVVQPTTYGFLGDGVIQFDVGEFPNPRLYVCLDLVGEPGLIEAFCSDHETLLAEKVVICQSVERWRIQYRQVAP